MDDIFKKATEAIDKAIACIKDNDEVKKELESVVSSQKTLSEEVAKAKKESADKDVAIASLTDKVEDLECNKFVSECRESVMNKNAEIAKAALEAEKEIDRRKGLLKENEIENQKTVAIALAFKTGQEFDSFLEATKETIAIASKKELDKANASVIKDQSNINTGGEMQITQENPVKAITDSFKAII